MKKQLKILLIGSVIFVIIAIIVILIMQNYSKIFKKAKQLESMSFNFNLESIEDNIYVNTDDIGRKVNFSEALKEEIFFDEKLGIYNISVLGDGTNTTVKYTIKNHSKDYIDGFDYYLQFVDDSGSILETIDLTSQGIPGFATYDVVLNVVGDVVGVYSIVPVYELEENGMNGDYYENY